MSSFLSQFQFAMSTAWAMSRSQSPFASSGQGDGFSFDLNSIDVTTYGALYATQLSLATTTSQTVDLTTLTNLVNNSFNFSTVLGIFVLVTGSQLKIEPGASNPATWFFTGTGPGVTVPAGGMFINTGAVDGTGAYTINSTQKNLKFTSSGLGTSTVTIMILGS